MAWYRLYHLGSDGQHVAPEDFSSSDDLGAVRKAKAILNAHGAELWMDRRKIADIPPTLGFHLHERRPRLFESWSASHAAG